MLFNEQFEISIGAATCSCEEHSLASMGRLALVLGGRSEGLRVDIRDTLGTISIDPSGMGHCDRHEIRMINTLQGSVRVLVLETMTDQEAADRYLVLFKRASPPANDPEGFSFANPARIEVSR